MTQRIMVTGHRNIYGVRADQVHAKLRFLLERFLHKFGTDITAVSGMAVGADIEFAEAALSLGIPITAAIPIPTQTDMWPEQAQRRYKRLLNQAHEVIPVWELPDQPLQMSLKARFIARDHWMVDNSDITVAVWDGRETGGTYLTINYARAKGRDVLVLNPNTLAMCILPAYTPEELEVQQIAKMKTTITGRLRTSGSFFNMDKCRTLSASKVPFFHIDYESMELRVTYQGSES